MGDWVGQMNVTQEHPVGSRDVLHQRARLRDGQELDGNIPDSTPTALSQQGRDFLKYWRKRFRISFVRMDIQEPISLVAKTCKVRGDFS